MGRTLLSHKYIPVVSSSLTTETLRTFKGRVDQGNTKDKLLLAALFSSIYLTRGNGDLSLKDLRTY